MPISGYFDVPFAIDGDLTAVPDAIQGSGAISYTQGWGPYYSQDPTVDPSTALLIDRAQTNQLFNDVTTAIQQYQQNGVPPFITQTMNGGISPYSYSKYNMVRLSDVVYISLVDTNTDTPPSSKWSPITLGAGLVAANNLDDVASLATTLTNLGFASNTTSYFAVPNPDTISKPWIIQFGIAASVPSDGNVSITFPITFPNACLIALATIDSVTTTPSGNYSTYAGDVSTTGMTISNDANATSPTSQNIFWMTIGN